MSSTQRFRSCTGAWNSLRSWPARALLRYCHTLLMQVAVYLRRGCQEFFIQSAPPQVERLPASGTPPYLSSLAHGKLAAQTRMGCIREPDAFLMLLSSSRSSIQSGSDCSKATHSSSTEKFKVKHFFVHAVVAPETFGMK